MRNQMVLDGIDNDPLLFDHILLIFGFGPISLWLFNILFNKTYKVILF
jgi:hypothetical protein